MTRKTDQPVELTGPAERRGRAQAASPGADAVATRAAIHGRLAEAAEALRAPEARRYLIALRAYAEATAPASLAELEGIAAGFAQSPDDLFAYLHAAIVLEIRNASRLSSADGCSAWATTDRFGAAWIGKNRDFRGEHRGLQRVFRHSDPDWGERRVLCVGSLGAPGAYSSGMNSDGLALADTQIATHDHGIGLCRYFLMSEILARCADVPEALELIRSLSHAGGGSLVLGDAQGRIAAVELGHRQIAVEARARGKTIARTNHFVSPELGPANLESSSEPMAESSRARLATLKDELTGRPENAIPSWTAAIMGSHDSPRAAGLCRHGQDGDAATISTALFATASRTLYFCAGNPCIGSWRHYRV